jgi:LPS O-antigen subunit length determinant protein (WzzB/FepE family)
MKKNNPYIADDEIDLADLIKSILREKVLILSISIICGLAGYLFSYFQTKNFKTEIKFNDPPFQLFEFYSLKPNNKNNNSNNENNNSNNENNNNNNKTIFGQFIYSFKINFTSLDFIESFLEESRDFDSFKEYLKSKNITVREYFYNRIGQVKEKNLDILNKYFLVFEKKLDGNIFLINYAEFVKKKTITGTKKNLEIEIKNRIELYEQALEIAEMINLEGPILKSLNNQNQVVNEPDTLFYKGSKVLSKNLVHLKKLLIKLENDQFDYNLILDKPSLPVLQTASTNLLFFTGLILGFLFSLVIIFLKKQLKQKF